MSKIVAYHNKFNQSFIEPLSAIEQNCLYALFHKLRDKGGDTVTISKKELITLTGFEKGGNRSFEDYILSTIGVLQNLKLRHTIDDKIIRQFTIFPELNYDTEQEIMSIRVADKFQPYINKLSGDFTNFPIEEFINIKSKYAKTIYRRLKQYNFLGVAILDYPQLIQQLGIPQSYSTSKIDTSILKPAIQELSSYSKKQNLFSQEKPFEELQYEKIKGSGRGRKIEKIKFTWKAVVGGISEAFKNVQDFKKWLIKNVDSGELYTNIFDVDGTIVSITRFERKGGQDYTGTKITLNSNTYTSKEEAEEALSRVYNSLLTGELEKYLIKENNPNNHSIIFLQALSKTMSDQEKLEWCSEENKKLFKSLLELKDKKLTLPLNITSGFFEEDEILIIKDVFIQYLTKEPCITFYSEKNNVEKTTPIKSANSIELLKQQIDKLASRDSVIEGFLL